MPDAITPALTETEWRRELSQERNGVDIGCTLLYAELASDGRYQTGEVEADGEPPPWLVLTWYAASEQQTVGRRHALAALALHGMPYGFTREDVAALHHTADNAERWIAANGGRSGDRDYHALDRARAALARLAALLPPP